MKEKKKIDLELTGLDALFMTDQERADVKKPKVDEIPLAELAAFKDHPFKVTEGEELNRLIDSIRESGVLVPALARPKEGGGYELISGHRRMPACQALGMETMPVIIRDLTDEEAIITMVDANLQRENISPSEKAFAYKMKLEALNHQGKASGQVGQKYSRDMIAENSTDSARQIQRYIRLTNLIPEILKMVDENKIALTPAVELSYLSESEQKDLLHTMECDEVTPSLSQAQRLRRMSEEQNLSADSIVKVMSEVKGNQVEYVKVPADKLKSYFKPGTTPQQMAETLCKAMDAYNRKLERQRSERDER